LYTNLTLISSTIVIVPDQYLTTVSFNVNPTIVPGGSLMAIELVVPEYEEFSGEAFMIGANGSGQTHPCYLASPLCFNPEPIDLAIIGFPDEHYIINVIGESEGIVDVPVSNWAVILAIGLMVVVTAIILRRRFA
jgi:hypothetical protein